MNGADQARLGAARDGVPALLQATAKLREIASAVDRASAVLDPTMELLEASHAIHRALLLLVDWRSAREDIAWLGTRDWSSSPG